MANSNVRVRMYRQGLGDCFLLSFPRQSSGDSQSSGASAQPYFYMLIDCGVVAGTPDAIEKMKAVAEDIYQTTEGHIDLVVGTHAHWDHLSGFLQAREVFDRTSMSEIWLPWTADPINQTAAAIKENQTGRWEALQTALTRLPGDDRAFAVQKNDAEQVLEFMGIRGSAGEHPDEAVFTSLDATAQRAMQYLATHADSDVHYCYPARDAVQTLDGVPDARIYLLGPCTDLRAAGLSSAQRENMGFGLSDLSAADSFLAAITPEMDNSIYTTVQSLCQPFDPYYRIDRKEVSAVPGNFFQDFYSADSHAFGWRMIESDWLSMTGELALSLDGEINNTSLALAIELGEPGHGPVLLFPGDAQASSWSSWNSLRWTFERPGLQPRVVTAADLITRTILYKVGHHGSHNGTPGETGLDLMTNEDLVAMLPVDRQIAAKKGWRMPSAKLHQLLLQKTRGRLLSIDTGLPSRQDARFLTDAQWNAFNQSVKATDLYIEYCL